MRVAWPSAADPAARLDGRVATQAKAVVLDAEPDVVAVVDLGGRREALGIDAVLQILDALLKAVRRSSIVAYEYRLRAYGRSSIHWWPHGSASRPPRPYSWSAIG